VIITGVIAEFNPFHNGHQYFLDTARKKTGADAIVCILSGNFTQRGEPAIIDKWVRTKMALQQGADLVIELPVIYAIQHAQGFASGACKLLNATGVIDYLVFGSEHGEISQLLALAKFLLAEPVAFQQYLQAYLKKGFLFPRAQATSLLDYHQAYGIPQLEHLSSNQLYTLIRHPNNILGLEYLKTLLIIESNMQPLTFTRYKADYHQPNLGSGRIASATAIRKALLSAQNWNRIQEVIPKQCWQILHHEITAGRGPIFLNDFSPQLMTLLRRCDLADLTKIAGMDEGLEHRLQRIARAAGTIEELLRGLKTKRYTRTRLQRLLLHFLLNISRKDANLFAPATMPCYLRVLGFTAQGQKVLRYIKKRASLPLITNPVHQLPPICLHSQRASRIWELECLATDLYMLANQAISARSGGQDYTRPLLIV
jgi:predicted nucleotidyltransferase